MKNLNIWEEMSFLSLWKFCGLKVWTKVHVKCLVILFNFIWIFLLLGLYYVAFGRRCLLIQPTKLFVNVDTLMLVSCVEKRWRQCIGLTSLICGVALWIIKLYSYIYIYIYIYDDYLLHYTKRWRPWLVHFCDYY